MKIAHVVPKKHLELADYGDFYFVLAHIAAKSKRYREHFKNQDREVYLDNGVWETGRPLDARTMVELAIEMKPDFVYATDYINDAAKTIQAVETFCRVAARHSGDFTSKIVATAQGSSRNVWYACIQRLSKIGGVDVIAIPRHPVRDLYEYESNRGLRMTKTRLDICHLINGELGRFDGKEFYATGAGAPLCVQELTKYPWITGIDTTTACLFASENARISGRFVKYKPEKQLDFAIEFTQEQLDTAKFNIDVLNRWAHGEDVDVE